MSFLKLLHSPYEELEELHLRLGDILDGETREFILDMENVGLLDSLVLGKLVRLHLSLKHRGVTLRLLNLSSHARLVINHANLDPLFGLAAPQPPRWDTETRA